tara:strand:- start:2248 stop:2490 length:243 start_codon:yes stop_codon:yes gene_type:complete
MSGNRFLDDFMRRQTELIVLEAGKPAKHGKPRKPKHGTADGQDPFEGSPFERICSEKPGRKEVVEYFRERIAGLVAEDLQ